MSNIGTGEIFVVLLLALIVLGPDKLPDAARKVGGLVRQVRSMSAGFQQEVRNAIDLGAGPTNQGPASQGDQPFHPDEARIYPPVDDASTPVRELESEVRARNDADADAPAASRDVTGHGDERAAS